MELDLLKRCGKILDWERQIPVPLMVNGKHICTVIVDFRVTDSSGHTYFLEYKGVQTPKYRLQMKLFRALFPAADYRLAGAKSR